MKTEVQARLRSQFPLLVGTLVLGAAVTVSVQGRSEAGSWPEFVSPCTSWNQNCRRLADPGNAETDFVLGEMHRLGIGVTKNASEAAGWYLKAAEKGHVGAQYRLGLIYENGWGVDQDSDRAASWYRQAAEGGDPNAQNNFGIMLTSSREIERNDREAVRMFRHAAEQGNPDALHNLGLMYLRGRGVERNVVQAHAWFLIAAEHGHPSAGDAVEETGRTLAPAEIARAQKIAREWRPALAPPEQATRPGR